MSFADTAHLVTADAAVPGPALNVMTRTCELQRIPMDNGGIESAAQRLAEAGWRVAGEWNTELPGYLTATLERR